MDASDMEPENFRRDSDCGGRTTKLNENTTPQLNFGHLRHDIVVAKTQEMLDEDEFDCQQAADEIDTLLEEADRKELAALQQQISIKEKELSDLETKIDLLHTIISQQQTEDLLVDRLNFEALHISTEEKLKAEGVFLDGLELRNAENDSKLNQAQAILTEIPFMRDYLTARDRCRYLMAALEEREEGGSEEYQISNPKRLCQDGVRSQGCKDEHKEADERANDVTIRDSDDDNPKSTNRPSSDGGCYGNSCGPDPSSPDYAAIIERELSILKENPDLLMGFDRDFGDTLTPHHHEHRHQHQDGKPQEPPRQDEVVIGDADGGNGTEILENTTPSPQASASIQPTHLQSARTRHGIKPIELTTTYVDLFKRPATPSLPLNVGRKTNEPLVGGPWPRAIGRCRKGVDTERPQCTSTSSIYLPDAESWRSSFLFSPRVRCTDLNEMPTANTSPSTSGTALSSLPSTATSPSSSARKPELIFSSPRPSLRIPESSHVTRTPGSQRLFSNEIPFLNSPSDSRSVRSFLATPRYVNHVSDTQPQALLQLESPSIQEVHQQNNFSTSDPNGEHTSSRERA